MADAVSELSLSDLVTGGKPRRQNALLDLLQGASNAAASTISGPVDLLTMGLRHLGYTTPDDQVYGSSEWMRKRGLTAEPQNKVAGILGETAGNVIPIAAAAKAPQIAGGLLKMAENAAKPRMLHPEQGAIVWHGTPHKFDAFDSSKIGTGEGAQAYGHGIYVAENQGVARGYQEKLSDSTLFLDGKPIDPTSAEAFVATDVHAKGAEAAKAAYLRSADKAADLAKQSGSQKMAESAANFRKWASMVDDIKGRQFSEQFGGNLYKVDLPDEAIGRMLDWDKPLSQQAPIKQAWQKENADWMGPFNSGTGKELLQLVRNRFDGDEAAAVDYLRKQGIPGIRYLDGSSRGAGVGSSNYVVFPGEESLLKILERNGSPLY